MERRNAEKQKHSFEEEFVKCCGLHDLQGLLIGDDDNFTAAVESFTYIEDEKNEALIEVFTDSEWRAKIAFAERLNTYLHVFIHQINSKNIYRYQIDSKSYENNTIKPEKMSEDDFIEWWKEHKKTIQTKKYRNELESALETSYFDKLLESHGLKWGGNIDGFAVTSDKSTEPIALIENRFTRNESIKTYDPLKYYYADIMTWKPLILLSLKLDIPCFLCTYSKRINEEHIMGISELVIDYSLSEPRFVNKDNIGPSKNLFNNVNDAKKWIFEHL